MIDYKLHNDCKAISGAEYKNSKIKAPNDWERIKTKSNILTGFRAGVYKKDNNNIIIKYKSMINIYGKQKQRNNRSY